VTAGWGSFLLAFAVFFASHAIPARPPVRRRIVAALGERGYLAAYVAVSLAVLAWLIVAAGRAPYVELWAFAPWQLWVPNIAMPIVCLLAAYGTAVPNPFSFGGRGNDRFDPDAPGITGVTRHPLLWAIGLWAVAHLVANGDLAHAVLFGTFAVFALLGMVMLDRRARRRLGAAEWRRLSARTGAVPLAALTAGRWRPRGWPSAARLAVAAAAWGLFLALHPALIGVSPLPAP